MSTFIPTGFALLALVIGLPTSAAHCMDYGPLGTGVWQFTGGSADTTFYLDDHDYLRGNGVWLFEETNGIWGSKLPGVYHAAYYWDQHDLQTGSCPNYILDGCAWTGCYSEPYVLGDAVIY